MDKMNDRKAAYDSVIQDLYAKRAQLDRAIEALEAMLNTELPEARQVPHGLPSASTEGKARLAAASASEETGGPLIGAIKSILRHSERPLGNGEIFKRLKAAGVEFRSANPQLSVSQAFSRNARLFGEPVRVGRGRWALRQSAQYQAIGAASEG
jgi:hypothetical protein